MTVRFRLEILADAYDRGAFDCGEDIFNRYFQAQVTQDIRRRVTNCLVAIENRTSQIAAYHTLAAASIPVSDLPPEIAKRLPRYPTLPAVRIGRLAVDRRFQKQGLGGALLADAAARTLAMPAAVFALLVDAMNERAVDFYRHHGFGSLTSAPHTLFLTLATAAKAFAPPGT